ncbi:MAG: P1 family peptidase, partial [Chloroflexota bacterium]
MATNTLTDVPGFLVGHATNLETATGCTAIICPPKTVGGVDVRGGAPGTRETDLLRPHNHVQEVSAIVLSGGSAFGLGSADGVVQYLEENELGYRSGTGFLVPIVPAAILFDLRLGASDVRPDKAMGYVAAQNASANAVPQGTVGAGTGAICGAMRGIERAIRRRRPQNRAHDARQRAILQRFEAATRAGRE